MNYETVAERICKFIKEQVEDKVAVVGISGGIDSALIATLCVKALGKEKVWGLVMPYGDLDQNAKDAIELADTLKIKHSVLNIKGVVEAFEKNGALGTMFGDKVVKGNLMARLRMCCLYAVANKEGGLVVGTTNRTEAEVGYYTKYGDGGVDIEPIIDLYKTDVWAMAKHLGVAEKFITKDPTAGLWGGQTDEGELGVSYKDLDCWLRTKIGKFQLEAKVNKLVKDSEHKRHMPRGCKLNEV